MSNKLFIICPFSGMEVFLQAKYGDSIFFISLPAAVVPHKDYRLLCALEALIEREKIGTVYLVNETSCRFINATLTKDNLPYLSAEKFIKSLYEDNLLSFRGKSLMEQQFKLAELNIWSQAARMMNCKGLRDLILECDLKITGLIASKYDHFRHEIDII